MSESNTTRRPKQERSLKTEQALLDALESLLSQKSFSDLTVSELAREANLTTGAIYRRFVDKRDILHCAFQRFYERSQTNTLTHARDYPDDMSDRSVLEKYISDLMRFTLEHIHLMRAANSLNDARSFELMTRARGTSADWLASRLQSSRYTPDELKDRCRFILRVVTATFRDTFLSGRGAAMSSRNYATQHEVDLKRLCTNLTDMACDYLSVY